MCNCNTKSSSPCSSPCSSTTNLDKGMPFPNEVNDLGIQIPILLVGSKTKLSSNVVYLTTSNPVFKKVRETFRQNIIQNGGYSSIEKNVLKLCDENCSDILEKVVEDYLTGFTWSFIKSQYTKYNTSEIPIVAFLIYNPNYKEIFNIGVQDGAKLGTEDTPSGEVAPLSSTSSASVIYCGPQCCGYGSSEQCPMNSSSCQDCCNYLCGRNYNGCEGGPCA